MIIKTIEGAISAGEREAFVQSFSKAWNSGDSLRVYYPYPKLRIPNDDGTFSEENRMIVDWLHGHKLNGDLVKTLRRVFLPSQAAVDEASGQVTEPDLAMRAARIVGLVREGRRLEELNRISNDPNITESVRRELIRKAEETHKNAQSPLQNRRLYRYTECVVVAVDENGKPIPGRVMHCTQDLSDSRLRALVTILRDKRMYKDTDDEVFEVEMIMKSTGNRKQDGQVDPKGLSKDWTIKDTYPDEYRANILPVLKRLAKDDHMLRSRKKDTTPYNAAALTSALSFMLADEGKYLNNITEDSDFYSRLRDNADLLSKFGVKLNNLDVEAECRRLTDTEDDTILKRVEESEKIAPLDSMENDSEIPEAGFSDNDAPPAQASTDSNFSDLSAFL